VRVDGQGVLVDRSGELLVPVRIETAGYVQELPISIGDTIKKGQTIRSKAFARTLASSEPPKLGK